MTLPLKLRQFYRFDGIRLPLRFPVRVLWDGRGPFEAAILRHPQTGAPTWATYENGYPVYLPCPKRRRRHPDEGWIGWHTIKGDRPDFWAPRDPDDFRLFKLPPVALTLPEDAPPRMWSTRQRYKSVEDAEDEEAEGDGEGKRKRGQKRQLWWLNGAAVRYAQPGHIKRDDAEGRIMRALAQEPLEARADGLGMHRNPLYGLNDAQIRELAEMEANALPDIYAQFEKVKADVEDYPVAMTWFAALGARELMVGQAASSNGWALGRRVGSYTTSQWVLLYASRDRALSFRKIASNLLIIEGRKITPRRVAQIYQEAIEAVWVIANEFSDIGRAKRADALAQLQEGNRRARGER
ncbi:hypothetical protein [Hyphomicrobium sp. 802]|uniref:hypothetical protein n=1 Tax=Hyphomicrobium sp. 802 TaxID=1112272 RepID=UPI0012DC880A|nr:hypothetical protein [Hyphomicrobium sp. 802]